MTAHSHPVSAAGRIKILDMLRGLAIFGILMVNMQIFYQPMTNMVLGYQRPDAAINLFSDVFIKFVFEGKFYVMFSLLFGYGFYIFMNKKTDEGSSIMPFYRRRVLFLLLFGLLHVILLWPGDILVFYALFGLILILFRGKKDASLVKWAIWLGVIPSVLVGFFALMLGLASLNPEAGAQIQAGMMEGVEQTQLRVEQVAAVYATGSFTEILRARMWEYQTMLPGMIFFYPMVLAMFLLGYWAGRKQLIRNYQDHLPFFRRAAWWGLGVGIILNLLFVLGFLNGLRQVPDVYAFLTTVGSTFGGFFLSLFYISGLVLLSARNKTTRLQWLLAPVGRMALTNYLLQSVICTTLFYGYGFGLFGKISSFEGILITLLIFGLQIPLSHFWLKRFHYGPMEWLWRSLTYLKLQPFKKQPGLALNLEL